MILSEEMEVCSAVLGVGGDLGEFEGPGSEAEKTEVDEGSKSAALSVAAGTEEIRDSELEPASTKAGLNSVSAALSVAAGAAVAAGDSELTPEEKELDKTETGEDSTLAAPSITFGADVWVELDEFSTTGVVGETDETAAEAAGEEMAGVGLPVG